MIQWPENQISPRETRSGAHMFSEEVAVCSTKYCDGAPSHESQGELLCAHCNLAAAQRYAKECARLDPADELQELARTNAEIAYWHAAVTVDVLEQQLDHAVLSGTSLTQKLKASLIKAELEEAEAAAKVALAAWEAL